MKRKRIALSVFLTVFLTFFAVGCRKQGGKENISAVDILETVVSLEKYEVKTLNLQEGAAEAVVWNSSNENVLSVEGGVVTAKGAGTATVYASIGDDKDACVITVTDNGYIPLLNVNVPSGSANIMVGQEFALSVYVTYNGNVYTDASYTFRADNDCLTVDESGVVRGVGTGSATVTVVANWHGADLPSLTTSVRFKVLS